MQLKQKKRKPPVVLAVMILSLMVLALSACSGNGSTVFHTGSEEVSSTSARVPWDYRIIEGTVGDLIGGDMTVLPDNESPPNDNNLRLSWR